MRYMLLHQKEIPQLLELSREEEKMIKLGALHHAQCMEIGQFYVSKLDQRKFSNSAFAFQYYSVDSAKCF